MSSDIHSKGIPKIAQQMNITVVDSIHTMDSNVNLLTAFHTVGSFLIPCNGFFGNSNFRFFGLGFVHFSDGRTGMTSMEFGTEIERVITIRDAVDWIASDFERGLHSFGVDNPIEIRFLVNVMDVSRAMNRSEVIK